MGVSAFADKAHQSSLAEAHKVELNSYTPFCRHRQTIIWAFDVGIVIFACIDVVCSLNRSPKGLTYPEIILVVQK